MEPIYKDDLRLSVLVWMYRESLSWVTAQSMHSAAVGEGGERRIQGGGPMIRDDDDITPNKAEAGKNEIILTRQIISIYYIGNKTEKPMRTP